NTVTLMGACHGSCKLLGLAVLSGFCPRGRLVIGSISCSHRASSGTVRSVYFGRRWRTDVPERTDNDVWLALQLEYYPRPFTQSAFRTSMELRGNCRLFDHA